MSSCFDVKCKHIIFCFDNSGAVKSSTIFDGNFEDEIEQDIKGRVLAPFKPVVRKAICASAEEVLINPRARSARLRVAERTGFSLKLC